MLPKEKNNNNNLIQTQYYCVAIFMTPVYKITTFFLHTALNILF